MASSLCSVEKQPCNRETSAFQPWKPLPQHPGTLCARSSAPSHIPLVLGLASGDRKKLLAGRFPEITATDQVSINHVGGLHDVNFPESASKR